MFKSINVKTVLIKADEIKKSSVVESSETSREQEMKKQNRGKVIMVGEDVAWPSVGMDVKYLFNAATEITDDEDGIKYQVINKVHILAELKNVP